MKNNKNLTVIAALACIIIFHVINNYFWIKNDTLSLYPEKYYQLMIKNHILSSIQEIIQRDTSVLDKISSIAKLTRIKFCWFGLYYIYTACVNLMFGNTTDVSLMANIPVFILLIIFTFLIGKNIAGEKAGILAAFFVSFYPGIYGISRSYGLDFPLTAMVTVCVYILIAKDITKIKYALFCGLVISIALLMKVQGIFFLIGPLVYIFFQRVYQSSNYGAEKTGSAKWRIFKITLAFGLLISSLLLYLSFEIPYWNRDIMRVAKVFFVFFTKKRHFFETSPHSLFDIRSVLFYLFESINNISRLLFVFFLFGLSLFCRTKLKYKMPVYLWIVAPYIIFTVHVNKSGRYYLPALPALALVSAVGILQIKPRRFRISLIIAAIFLSLFQFYDLSFGTNILPKILYRYSLGAVAYPPQKNEEDKVVTRFLEVINKERDYLLPAPTVLLVGHPDLIDSGKLEYVLQNRKADLKFDKFFASGYNYKNCGYIIVVNGRMNNTGKLDLSFLKTFDYKGFLAVSYSEYRISNTELEDMYNTFMKFKPVDHYLAGDLIYYLCKNTGDKK